MLNLHGIITVTNKNMNKEWIILDKIFFSKENFMELYNQLPTNYQYIVMSTFRCLVSCDDDYIEKGYKPFDVAGLIIMKRDELGLSNKEICEQVTKLFQAEHPESKKILMESDFHKMLRRNTQSSKSSTNWLTYIAKVLCFDVADYKKHLTTDGLKHASEQIQKQSFFIYDIEKIFDNLDGKAQLALWYLTLNLLVQIV